MWLSIFLLHCLISFRLTKRSWPRLLAFRIVFLTLVIFYGGRISDQRYFGFLRLIQRTYVNGHIIYQRSVGTTQLRHTYIQPLYALLNIILEFVPFTSALYSLCFARSRNSIFNVYINICIIFKFTGSPIFIWRHIYNKLLKHLQDCYLFKMLLPVLA